MLEQGYVKFCDEAHDLRRRAEGFFAQLSEHELQNLQGLVREETRAGGGSVEVAYDFLRVLLDEEVAHRAKYPDKAFEDAVTDFVLAKDEARDALATKLMSLPDDQWGRARQVIGNWIVRGGSDAKLYQRVVEMVDYERERQQPAEALPREVPF